MPRNNALPEAREDSIIRITFGILDMCGVLFNRRQIPPNPDTPLAIICNSIALRLDL
jgi:hypothetical protein